jgi:hypothetical protein
MGSNGARFTGNPDEETHSYISFDLLARMGADKTGAQERHSAHRQLRADRPYRGRQAGLLDEVREFARAGTSATASAGRSHATFAFASAAGGSSHRNFRSVLRGEAAGRVSAFDLNLDATILQAGSKFTALKFERLETPVHFAKRFLTPSQVH